MNDWPGLEAYNSALASPDSRLIAPGLAGATVCLNPWGVPNALSGGFAFIYDLKLSDGSRKALRLFHSGNPERATIMKAAYHDVENVRESSQQLARFLVAARWEDSCIEAGNRQVPGVVMDWVDSPTLGAWLESHYDDAKALESVRQQLCVLQEALSFSGMVHGDLQTGNLAVREDGSLVLLDYDGFRHVNDTATVWESGHLHFRHPDQNSPQSLADRFPLLSMDIGLAAMIAEPSMFKQWSNGENILFTGEDYIEPESSGALEALSKLPGFGRTVDFFRAVCHGPAEAIPTLIEFHEAAGIPSGNGHRYASADNAPDVILDDGNVFQVALSTLPSRKTRGPYLGPYPVYNPIHYSDLSGVVGYKVEFVGRVVSVKKSFTKYNKPYAFVNFNDWRQSGTKLIWWSEDLEAAGDLSPEEDWEGTWISAIGLVDAPYRNERFGTIQYSITIVDSSQVRAISEDEAKRRLETVKGMTDGEVSTIHNITLASSSIGSIPKKTSNTELLNALNKLDISGSPQLPQKPLKYTMPLADLNQFGTPTRASNKPSGCRRVMIALGILALVYFILRSVV